jgi:hypothetical protein
MKKADALATWRNLPEGQNPLAHMTPIAYKSTGSSYGACGVRIDGNPAFVEAVLSCLKALIAGENSYTRLELSRQPVNRTFKPGLSKAEGNAEVCYVRLHERGREAQHVNAFLGVIGMGQEATREADATFARALGLDTDR